MRRIIWLTVSEGKQRIVAEASLAVELGPSVSSSTDFRNSGNGESIKSKTGLKFSSPTPSDHSVPERPANLF